MTRNSTKIAVAMSGGVDSSVATLLLKQQGFDVTGITMRIWSCEDNSNFSTVSLQRGNLPPKKLCCSTKDTADAKKVAAILSIPHYIIDLRTEFGKYIIKPFCKNYISGLTPYPCILCNQKIKFDILLRKIRYLGFDYLATGHYAQIEKKEKRFILKKAKDLKSDQSYWLYSIPEGNLKYILFPLANYTKQQVRNLAKKYKLPTALKPKSQEICFIKNRNYKEFIKTHNNTNKTTHGDIVDLKGKYLGQHSGIFNFTIGQRTGLGISVGKRTYVVDILPKENKIVVGEGNNLYKSELIANNVFWLTNYKKLKFPLKVKAKIRYKHKESEAIVYPYTKNSCRIKFTKPQRAITPGQSVVFYNRDTILGGGIINVNKTSHSLS